MNDTQKHFVYFIESGDFIKIGHSKDPEFRRKEMQGGNPIKLIGLGKIPCECKGGKLSRGRHCDQASILHGLFRNNKIAYLHSLNEWYHKSLELLQYIEDHAQEW